MSYFLLHKTAVTAENRLTMHLYSLFVHMPLYNTRLYPEAVLPHLHQTNERSHLPGESDDHETWSTPVGVNVWHIFFICCL